MSNPAETTAFNLFSMRQTGVREVVGSGIDLVRRMDARLAPRRAALAAIPEDDYFDVDGRLMSAISSVLESRLGSDVGDEAVWYQHCGGNDDGVRHLSFRREYFPTRELPALQSLLRGEFEPFCILCWIQPEDDSGDNEDGLVLFSDAIVITRRLANDLVSAPGI